MAAKNTTSKTKTKVKEKTSVNKNDVRDLNILISNEFDEYLTKEKELQQRENKCLFREKKIKRKETFAKVILFASITLFMLSIGSFVYAFDFVR